MLINQLPAVTTALDTDTCIVDNGTVTSKIAVSDLRKLMLAKHAYQEYATTTQYVYLNYANVQVHHVIAKNIAATSSVYVYISSNYQSYDVIGLYLHAYRGATAVTKTLPDIRFYAPWGMKIYNVWTAWDVNAYTANTLTTKAFWIFPKLNYIVTGN